LTAALAGKDEALTPEFALMVTGKPRSTFYRLLGEGKIPTIVHVGRFSRFSLEALKALSSD
jgi:predicted DNA-binding transcriptional regulator AlpA